MTKSVARMGRLPAGVGVGRGSALRLLLLSLALVVPSASEAADVEITVDGEQMSAEFGSVPIAEVLAAVAKQTGAQLSIRGELGNARPQAFARVPLAEALPRVVQPNGVILQFAASEQRGNGGRRLVAIRAVAPGSPGTPTEGSSGVRPFARNDPRHGLPPGFWDYQNTDVPLPDTADRIDMLKRTAGKPGPATSGVLAYALRSDPEPSVRQTALALLATATGDDARRAITETVADPDPELRAAALRALSAAGREKPVPLLAQAVRGDADPTVRIAAIGLLTRQDGDVARAVLEGARADADAQVREAAEQALRR